MRQRRGSFGIVSLAVAKQIRLFRGEPWMSGKLGKQFVSLAAAKQNQSVSRAVRKVQVCYGVQCSIERRSLQIGEFGHGATVCC